MHRDIKPDNFVMGIEAQSTNVFVVDFGLAKQYHDPKRKVHIPYKDGKSLTGTARYASIHAHMGEELSRRDDLEALGIVMIYFYKGSLPWMNLTNMTKSEKYKQIKKVKLHTPIQ